MHLPTLADLKIYLFFGVILAALSIALTFGIGMIPLIGTVLTGLLFYGVMHWYTQSMYDGGPAFPFMAMHAYTTLVTAIPALLINPPLAAAIVVGYLSGLGHAALNGWRRRRTSPHAFH